MNKGEALLKATGVAGIAIIAAVLAFDSVDDNLVILLVSALLALTAPDMLKEVDWGPFN